MKATLKHVSAVVLGLTFTLAAHGGDSRGNGGNTVVCRDPNSAIRSIELLDYYEGRELRGIHRSLYGTARGYLDQIDLALERLAPLDPERARRYQMGAREFEANTVFQPGVILVKITDSFHLSFPKDCAVEQIAIQREPQFPEDRRFLVSRDLWDALDPENQAGLVLHELILQEAVSVGQQDSLATRYFVTLITSPMLLRMTPAQYLERLGRMHLPPPRPASSVF